MLNLLVRTVSLIYFLSISENGYSAPSLVCSKQRDWTEVYKFIHSLLRLLCYIFYLLNHNQNARLLRSLDIGI